MIVFEEAEYEFTSTNDLKFLFKGYQIILSSDVFYADKDDFERARQEAQTAHHCWSSYIFVQRAAEMDSDLSDAELAQLIKGINDALEETFDWGYWAQKWHEPFTEDMARWACIHHRERNKWHAEHSPKGGYIYLLRSVSGHYKIGRSKNPKNRIKTFGVQLPFEVEYIVVLPSADMIEFEKTWHEWFAHKRVNGEWFDLNDDDVEFMIGYAS